MRVPEYNVRHIISGKNTQVHTVTVVSVRCVLSHGVKRSKHRNLRPMQHVPEGQ